MTTRSEPVHYEDRCTVKGCPEPNSEVWHRCFIDGKQPIQHQHWPKLSQAGKDSRIVAALCPTHHDKIDNGLWTNGVHQQGGKWYYWVLNEKGQTVQLWTPEGRVDQREIADPQFPGSIPVKRIPTGESIEEAPDSKKGLTVARGPGYHIDFLPQGEPEDAGAYEHAPEGTPSRSEQRRVAAQKGEPAPTFDAPPDDEEAPEEKDWIASLQEEGQAFQIPVASKQAPTMPLTTSDIIEDTETLPAVPSRTRGASFGDKIVTFQGETATGPKPPAVLSDLSLPAVPSAREQVAKAQYGDVGLQLPDNLTRDQWEGIMETIQQMVVSVPWWVGDALVYGQRFGEEMWQAIKDRGGADYEKLRKYMWVAEKVPIGTRVPALKWSHHREVADLEPELQREWLQRAQDESLGANALRVAIKNDDPKLSGDCDESIDGKHVWKCHCMLCGKER